MMDTNLTISKFNASLAQLVEQLIRNEQVVGSSPMRGSVKAFSGRASRLVKSGRSSVQV